MTLAIFFGSHQIERLLASYGYAIVFLIVSAESLGIPMPGETTLTLAAIYAGATGKLNIALVIIAAAAGAIIGDNIGYGIGRAGDYRLLQRYGQHVHINEQRLKIGHYLFDRHGGKVVFFGRFISILRTYAAFLAGTTRMHWARFLLFNAAGGIVWASVYGSGYYYFGTALKHLQGTIDVAIGTAALALTIGALVWLRGKEAELAAAAESAELEA